MAPTNKTGAKDKKAASPDERTAYQRWLDVLAVEADLMGNTEADFMWDEILSDVLEAETMDEAFELAKKQMDSGKSLTDVELRITDVTIHHSNITSTRFKFIARAIGTRLDTGEEVKLNVGAPKVVTLLWKARETEGEMPIEVVVRASDLGEGKVMLNLERIRARVV